MKIPWWGVSSCTTDLEVLESNKFLGKHGLRILFSIEYINGKSIVNHSHFKNIEKEIILMLGSFFQVMGQLNPTPEVHIIHLKEITPPITLIKPTFSKSNDINSSSIVNEPSPFPPSTSSDNVPKEETDPLDPSRNYLDFFKYLVFFFN